MALKRLQVNHFRCIQHADLHICAGDVLISGANGAGKTSLLEAIYCLSRGRSFRSTRTDQLVQFGEKQFQVYGEVGDAQRRDKLGLGAGKGNKSIRINGEDSRSIAALAALLPVDVIDPEIHSLVAEGPDKRRRFVDYGVFHVEQGFLAAWRDYRRALNQRNKALKLRLDDREIDNWDALLAEHGERVATARNQYVQRLNAHIADVAAALLDGTSLQCQLKPGWNDEQPLAEAIREARPRDREIGQTTRGPHRADLLIRFNEQPARQQVSRGQQKLVASTLVLAQCDAVRAETGKPSIVLLDDPAAELDTDALQRLLHRVRQMGTQLVVTALNPDDIDLGDNVTMFHVEHGEVRKRA